MLLIHGIIIALLQTRIVWGDTSCYVCDDSMYRFDDSCYQFNTDKTDLQTAKTNCETIGFHLVYIESSQEQVFLASSGNTVSPRRDYWIGIEKNAAGEQVWMDGTAVIYSNFDIINEGGECFRLKRQDDYIWADRGCDQSEYGYICERERVCEENMYTFGESCYRFKTDETTFTTANTNCEASGFHLVYIETSQEQDFLASTADTVTPEQEYWIGIEKNDAGENVWMDGSAISFSNFGKIKDKDDYCFRMRKEDKDHAWEDHQCDHDHYGFICESEGGCDDRMTTQIPAVTTQSPTTHLDPKTTTIASTPTEPTTTIKVASTEEGKILTTVNIQQTLEALSTKASTSLTESSSTRLVQQSQQTLGSTASLPSSTATRTTEKVLSTIKVSSTTDIESQTTATKAATTQTNYSPTSGKLSTTTTRLSSIPSTTKTEQTSDISSSTSRTTLGSTASLPSSTVSRTTEKVLSTIKVSSTTDIESQTTATKTPTTQTTYSPTNGKLSTTTTRLSSIPPTTKTEQTSDISSSTSRTIPGSTASLPSSTAIRTTEKVLSTIKVSSTTDIESQTTATMTPKTQTTYSPTSGKLSTTTTRLSSIPSTTKTEQTSGIPSSTSRTTPAEKVITSPATRRRLVSNNFRLLATDTMIMDAFVSLTTTAHSTLRCASSCILVETCSHFSYASSSSRCILGYNMADKSSSFVEHTGSKTYAVY